MRISSIEQFQQGIDSILNQQAKLNQTQLQLATGKKVLKPSDDPAVATQLLNLSSLKANNLQYDRNINTALNELELQEGVLASSGNVLQRVRELVIQANNATQSPQTREAIADEISNLADELLQLSNSKSPSGEYIFAGYNSRTPAFAKSGAGYVYQGDQGQRLLQVSEDTQLAVRDNGADVFQGMTTGDGRFLLETPASNTGDGLVKMSSTIDAISDNYTITFIQANPGDPLLYSVSGEDVGAVATGTFAAGEAINFNGISIEIEGSLENGDSYAINRSIRQDVFQSVQAIASALLAGTETGAKSSKLANDLGQSISTMDQALEHLQSRRTIVGNRLQALDTRASENADGLLRLERQTSELNDLDFAEAVSRLNLQTTALQAAQQSYIKIQGLSLFNYLR
ncbi:flagellar hook-associated protein FlgL [Pseudomonadales bacterium]|nr:flagellar hook-associated protein FlgL [Pseudomonadales bacterium]